MNKKIVAIVLVIALALTSAFAATTGTSKKGDVSVGAGIGTGVEVVARYGMGKFDLQGGVSLDFLSGNSFAINGGAFYNFADWTFKTGTLAAPQKISFTTGPLAKVLVKDGVGLGLYIVKTILEQHKEKINVTSENDVTTFSFSLAAE